MGIPMDMPIIYMPEAHDVFFYDGQRFHQKTPQWEGVEPKYSLRPLPLELEGSAPRWYFSVVQEDGLRGPIGFCAHCPGHETPGEACTHYAEYLFEMIMMGTYLPILGKEGSCAVCKKKTRGYAEIESLHFTQQWFLCDRHRSAECLKKRFRYDMDFGRILLLIEPYARYRHTNASIIKEIVKGRKKK